MLVYEKYGVRVTEGTVGVEIEVEGDDLPLNILSNYWKDEEDNSLRGGREYVLKKPISIAVLPKALSSLGELFKECGSSLNFSHRTSVHVHINVSQMEVSDLKKFVFLAYLLDTALAEIGGREIKGNRFALRLKDAQGIYFILKEFFETGRIPNQNEAKYSSINLCPIGSYGSVEFRSMRGTFDYGVLTHWCELLVNIRNTSLTFKSMKEIYEMAVEHPDKLIKQVFPDDFFYYENLQYDVQSNISLLAGLHTIRG